MSFAWMAGHPYQPDSFIGVLLKFECTAHEIYFVIESNRTSTIKMSKLLLTIVSGNHHLQFSEMPRASLSHLKIFPHQITLFLYAYFTALSQISHNTLTLLSQ